jgi:hypothetical protein
MNRKKEFGLCAEYTFHPVGQGLFASGALTRCGEAMPCFRWVYDCGTLSAKKFLRDEIDRFVSLAGGKARKPHLDLVAISHFDKDHINGIVELLSRVTVDILLMPYIPLWQRLVLAFVEGVSTQDPLMQFFVNPVAYIAGLEDAKVNRIVFVPGRDDEGSLNEGNLQHEPSGEGEGSWKLGFESKDPTDEEQKLDIKESMKKMDGDLVSVVFMKPSGLMYIKRIWEFVPYNDINVYAAPNQVFQNKVRKMRDALVGACSDLERNKALDSLRAEYDDHFGKSSRMRNIISLFLYAGPIGAPSIRCRGQRFGIIYTGDGYLHTRRQLTQLKTFLGDRIKRLSCLQVMHHGAKGNWRAGLAKALAPDVSVFSSDPQYKYHHPHGYVVRDFLPYFPVQVDTHCGLTIVGSLI